MDRRKGTDTINFGARDTGHRARVRMTNGNRIDSDECQVRDYEEYDYDYEPDETKLLWELGESAYRVGGYCLMVFGVAFLLEVFVRGGGGGDLLVALGVVTFCAVVGWLLMDARESPEEPLRDR